MPRPFVGPDHLCVVAYNDEGEGLRGSVHLAGVDDFGPPGAVRNLQISIGCDSTCTVTITEVPLP